MNSLEIYSRALDKFKSGNFDESLKLVDELKILELAITAGAALRMEALQIKLVDKDAPFDRGDKPAYAQKVVKAPTV